MGNRSISAKLTWMNMLVSAAALLIACSAFFAFDAYAFRRGIVENLSVEGKIIGANTASALLFNDPRAADGTLAAMAASPNIVHAQIFTPNRQLFASYARAGQTQTHRFTGDRIAQVSSIVFQGKPVGFVYLESDLAAMNNRRKSYALIAGSVLIMSLIAALLISRISQRAISAPVVRLAGIARVVSRDKDYSIRVPAGVNRDELSTLIEAFNEMLEQIQERDTALQTAQNELEQRVQDRTAELAAANQELEAFSYSVAHDLRAPLRGIDGFSQALLEECGAKLDADGQNYLQRVRAATVRMSGLIDDLLNLSRVARSDMSKQRLDLSAIATVVAADLRRSEPNRPVEFVIEPNVSAMGDPRLLRVVIENLLGNAWKYTGRHERARIEFGRSSDGNGRAPCYVRDDGAGFDPRYASRMFRAFQRLHSTAEFPGTGVGLATVQRIVHRHGGEIWAEAAIEKGATFFFTLSPSA